MSHARLSAPLIALVALLVLAPAADAKTRATTVRTSQGTITTTRGTDGVRHLKFRWGPVRIAPGQNTISLDDDNLLPAGPVLDHLVQAQPHLRRRQGAARRRHPSAPRGLDRGRPADVGRRRGEDRGARAQGLRLALSHVGPLAAQPHDPQPHAGGDPGLHHLGDGLHPARHEGGTRDEGGQGAMGRRDGGQRLSGVRRHRGHGPRRARHLPRRRSQRLRRRRRAQPVARRSHDATLVGTAGHLHPGGLWTDLKLTRARAHGGGLPLARALLRARRRGVLGRVDDRHAADLASRAEEGRRASRCRRPTTCRTRRGTRRWRSWWSAPTTHRLGGVDPFIPTPPQQGVLTHGDLRENDAPRGGPVTLPDATSMPRRRSPAERWTSPASPTPRAT